MKMYLLAAVAALAIGGTATAGGFDQNAEQACMRYGVASSSCQFYRQQQQTENRLRQLEEQQRAQTQRCAMFGRC
jgi:hypothetical protein